MASAAQSVEFETMLTALEGLSSREVAELVKEQVSRKDAEAFDVLVDGLPSDAVRFLAARALLRLRLSPVAQSRPQ